ncbi:MAG: glycosyltransferase [Candidatus Acidiferrum sp.]
MAHLNAECCVTYTTLIVGFLSVAIWMILFFGRGGFWRLREFDGDREGIFAPAAWPGVIAIVPARNEAATIGQSVASLVGQEYAGEFRVVVVDDHSDDGTAEMALCSARGNSGISRIMVHSAPPLPAGWTGKLWAMNEGVKAANASVPEFYWFTDADIVHSPDTLRRLVARAEGNALDLTSLMVQLQAKTLPERALIPAFLYFFLKLYPPRWIADPQARTAGAAGGCILLRGTALEKICGLASIRSEVIDDCALARRVKRSGGRLWMGVTRSSVSLRSYENWGELRDMIARTAFTQLGYSSLLLAATLLGLLLTYIAPIFLLVSGNAEARLLGLAASALMTISYLPTVRFYRLSPLWAPTLPFAALFYSYATCLSAVRFWLGRGGQWKGRSAADHTA